MSTPDTDTSTQTVPDYAALVTGATAVPIASMSLHDAETLARELMNKHGLTGRGRRSWRFKFDNALLRAGCCHDSTRTISLSRQHVVLNSESEVRNTILHEIAHALTPKDKPHHGNEWKQIAKRIGCTGERGSHSGIITPKTKYVGTCPGCRQHFDSHRREKWACSKCDLRLQWQTRAEFEAVPPSGNGNGNGHVPATEPRNMEPEAALLPDTATELTPEELHINSLWTALQAAEEQRRNRGLAFGQAMYEYRKTSEVVSGGTTFRSTLEKLAIPHATAYRWIVRYEESIGVRSAPVPSVSEPVTKPEPSASVPVVKSEPATGRKFRRHPRHTDRAGSDRAGGSRGRTEH